MVVILFGSTVMTRRIIRQPHSIDVELTNISALRGCVAMPGRALTHANLPRPLSFSRGVKKPGRRDFRGKRAKTFCRITQRMTYRPYRPSNRATRVSFPSNGPAATAGPDDRLASE